MVSMRLVSDLFLSSFLPTVPTVGHGQFAILCSFKNRNTPLSSRIKTVRVGLITYAFSFQDVLGVMWAKGENEAETVNQVR